MNTPTIIRYKEHGTGFATVVSLSTSDSITATVQLYQAFSNGRTVLAGEVPFSSERAAVAHFERNY